MKGLDTYWQMVNTASKGGYISFDRGIAKYYGHIDSQHEVAVIRTNSGMPMLVKIGRDDHSANERIDE